MNVILLAALAVVVSLAIIIPAYAIYEPIRYVTYSGVGIFTPGNYTFEMTLTDLLKDGNNDEIRGELGFSFRPAGADLSEKKYYYKNFSVYPNELPKTFYFDVPFTDIGRFTVTNHYQFFQITHHAFATVYPKGGNIFNSFKVIGEYGKATDENGNCKNSELRRIIKPDFSSFACVYDSTHAKLVERGWTY